MAEPDEGELVEFLRRETGEYLYAVLQYDADAWETLYLDRSAESVHARMAANAEGLLESFRREGRRRARLTTHNEVGAYYCSLHLFDGVVLLHFSQPGPEGIILGYDPDAASHLTDFVSLILPYVRDAGLDELDGDPDWARP